MSETVIHNGVQIVPEEPGSNMPPLAKERGSVAAGLTALATAGALLLGGCSVSIEGSPSAEPAGTLSSVSGAPEADLGAEFNAIGLQVAQGIACVLAQPDFPASEEHGGHRFGNDDELLGPDGKQGTADDTLGTMAFASIDSQGTGYTLEALVASSPTSSRYDSLGVTLSLASGDAVASQLPLSREAVARGPSTPNPTVEHAGIDMGDGRSAGLYSEAALGDNSSSKILVASNPDPTKHVPATLNDLAAYELAASQTLQALTAAVNAPECLPDMFSRRQSLPLPLHVQGHSNGLTDERQLL